MEDKKLKVNFDFAPLEKAAEKLSEIVARINSSSYGLYEVSPLREAYDEAVRDSRISNGAGYVSMVNDNPNRQETVRIRDLQTLDFNGIRTNWFDRLSMSDHMHAMSNIYGVPSQLLTNKNKTVYSFTKDKEVKVICQNLSSKHALMEYARSAGVPTLCRDDKSDLQFPHIGWSGNSICGFDNSSMAVSITAAKFVEYCDNWKESQKPVIKLNHEQSVKVEYDEKVILAGCNHQYRIPFKLVDEIHAKIHEMDKPVELKRFKAYEWLPVFNADLYRAAIKTANDAGIKFAGGDFEGTEYYDICVFIDSNGNIQWGNKKANYTFTKERELSQSDFLERCLNHGK